MKKQLLLLVFLVIGHGIIEPIYAGSEVKIYRSKLTKSGVAVDLVLATSLGVIGVLGIGAAVGVVVQDYKKDFLTADSFMGPSVFAIVGSIPLIISMLSLKQMKQRHDLRDKPKLILDDEGFTYEELGILSLKPVDKRYLWKNVRTIESRSATDQHGNILSNVWHFGIRGEKQVVTIDLADLDISSDLKNELETRWGLNA